MFGYRDKAGVHIISDSKKLCGHGQINNRSQILSSTSQKSGAVVAWQQLEDSVHDLQPGKVTD